MVSLFDPLVERSTETEWLDDPAFVGPALYRNLRELETINRFLGGHASLVRCVRRALPWLNKRPLHVVDVGCGSGDGLRALSRWGRREGIALRLVGLDANPEVLDFARSQSTGYDDITYLHGDAFGDFFPAINSDLVVASLFCHHFGSHVLQEWLSKVLQTTRALAISDLHRHSLAHIGFRALSRLARASPMTKNDGAVSIRRGFTRPELEGMIAPLRVKHASINWSFAFRYEVLLVASD